MSDPHHPIQTAVIASLLGTAICFRLMYLSSIPGISGDEGWWGVQAIAWLSGRPFEARTTSGNPIDLFFLIPLALVHAIAPPSFLLLRILPALVNLLALPIGFWFVRRLYGSTTAWIYTVALAIMPAAIAHSRICQDPSQSVFWTTIVIGLCLLGLKQRPRALAYLGGALVIFLVAFWTHPTNVFIAPFLVLPFVAATARLLPSSRRQRAIVFAVAALVAALVLSTALPALGHLATPDQHLDRAWLSMARARVTDGAQWFEFAANNARLFNGVTVYHYFSGARPATVPYDVGFVVLVVAALSGFLLTPASRRSRLDYPLIFACTGTWLGFYAFAGPEALRPHFERWGLCLIVPGTLVLARGVATSIESMPRLRWPTIATATLVAAAMLASFYVNYFREFATTGGRSHLTYVTAAIEPKQQALDDILHRSPGLGAVTIVTRQWWLRWPMAYLATPHRNVSVRTNVDMERDPGFREALASGRLFFVEFTRTPELAAELDWIHARGQNAETTIVRDAGGREHLAVVHVTALLR